MRRFIIKHLKIFLQNSTKRVMNLLKRLLSNIMTLPLINFSPIDILPELAQSVGIQRLTVINVSPVALHFHLLN